MAITGKVIDITVTHMGKKFIKLEDSFGLSVVIPEKEYVKGVSRAVKFRKLKKVM